jgi:hypothetical protein
MHCLDAGLVVGGGENREHSDAFATGLGGARRSGGVEHAIEDGRVLLAVRTCTELGADVGAADGGDGLDAVVDRSRRVAQPWRSAAYQPTPRQPGQSALGDVHSRSLSPSFEHSIGNGRVERAVFAHAQPMFGGGV